MRNARRWTFAAFALGLLAGAAFAVGADDVRSAVAPQSSDGRTDVLVVVENVGRSSVTVVVSFEAYGERVHQDTFVVRPAATASREGPTMRPGEELQVSAFFQGSRGRGDLQESFEWEDCGGGRLVVRFVVDATNGMSFPRGAQVACG